MEDLILIYTFSQFPIGDANSNRILAYAKSMQECGYQIIVLTSGELRKIDYNSTKQKYQYKGIEYRSYYKSRSSKIVRIINRNNIVYLLNTYLTKEEFKRLKIICTSYRNYSLLSCLILKLYKIISIVDATEWFSNFQFKGGYFSIKFIKYNLRIKYILPLAKNIMCVSKYFEKYYNKKHCNTLYLPPQVLLSEFKQNKINNIRPLKLFYAGNIHKKDHIWLMLEALMKFESISGKIELTIAGCTRDNFINNIPNSNLIINKLGDNLKIIGRIPRDEVIKKLSESHFMILARPVSRYSMAGFPSKVPEALAAGVPVITNLTSDLADYLHHMENSIIIEDFSVDSCVKSINDALNVTNEQFAIMSKYAYKTAADNFNYKKYNKDINWFLSELQVRG